MSIERRAYFLAGDLIANATTGALVGLATTVVVGPAWNMWLGMVVAMAMGMLLALALGFVLFFVLFGAMEVMIPTMLTGMTVGMVVGMAVPMGGIGIATGAEIGALIGLGTLLITYAANLVLRRQGHTECNVGDQGIKEDPWMK